MHLTRFLHLHVVNSTCAHLPKGLYAACLPLISLSTAVEKEDTNPYNISTMEMRSLWQRITCIKNPASPLNWTWVCKGGWYLSKEVLWVSVGQLAAKLQAVKVGGVTKNSAIRPKLNLTSAARVRLPDNRIILQL